MSVSRVGRRFLQLSGTKNLWLVLSAPPALMRRVTLATHGVFTAYSTLVRRCAMAREVHFEDFAPTRLIEEQ
jgi:hypothetical protein